MVIRLLENNFHDQYDRFLKSDDRNSFFYSLKYRLFLEGLLNCKSEYWIAESNGEIKGILPLMYKTGSLGIAVNSLPFYGSNGGVIAKDKEAFSLLLQKYREIVNDEKVCASNLITHPLMPADYSSLAFDETDERIGQYTPIEYPAETCEDNLMESFHYKTRNMVRKAVKSVSEIEIDNNAFPFLRETHNENMQSIGGKAKSDLFFDLIPEYFEAGVDYKIYVAKSSDGYKMSALLLFYFNKTVEYFTPVIKHEYRDLQPLSALIYRSMADACKQGYKYWNWGGTWKSQEGVYRFKSRWNTSDHPYYYYNKINNKEIYNSNPAQLLKDYPDFYVIPFNKLKNVGV